jgi:hypothetical protein
MKALGIIFTIVFSASLFLSTFSGIKGTYEFEKDVYSYWKLADKASTITQKAEYIDKFVVALDQLNYQGTYNAVIFPTPDNSYDKNFEALISLQTRLHEIKLMDVTSFEYQTAIQQITEQEQGGAYDMLEELKGLWWKNNHILLWDWIGFVQILLSCILFLLGIIIWDGDNY